MGSFDRTKQGGESWTRCLYNSNEICKLFACRTKLLGGGGLWTQLAFHTQLILIIISRWGLIFFFLFWGKINKSHGGLHAFPSCADRCWDIQFVRFRCELYMKIAFRYSAIFEDSSPWCSGKYTAINSFYRYCIFNRLHLKTCSNKKLSAWLDIRKGRQKIKRHLKMISWPLNNF